MGKVIQGNRKLGQGEVTLLLQDWNKGNDQALHELIPMVYKDLHAAAYRQLGRESGPITLQPTDLVNETYLRLANHQRMAFDNRRGFFWFASQLIRRILVEYARARFAAKRGAGQALFTLQTFDAANGDTSLDAPTLIAIDEALSRLKKMDPRQGQIVEMRFFWGLENE